MSSMNEGQKVTIRNFRRCPGQRSNGALGEYFGNFGLREHGDKECELESFVGKVCP